MSARILILNGPNLNMLGQREAEHYGRQTFGQIFAELEQAYPCFNLDYYQSNHEGDIIDRIHQFNLYKGIIINAGAYSHYSYAIQDALKLADIPKVEVHMSNIHAREAFRHTSVISPVCQGVICGFGKESYSLALEWFKRYFAHTD